MPYMEIAHDKGIDSFKAALVQYESRFPIGSSGRITLEFPGTPFDILTTLGKVDIQNSPVAKSIDDIQQDGNKLHIKFTVRAVEDGKAHFLPFAAVGLAAIGTWIVENWLTIAIFAIIGIALAALLWHIFAEIPMPLIIAGVFGVAALGLLLFSGNGSSSPTQVVYVGQNPYRRRSHARFLS